MDIRYAPIWLRERDLDQLFTEHGIAESDRREWLSRAVRDRGIVTTRKADPAVDLFRLASPPSPLVGGFARRWKPNPDDIDWDIFGIRSPVSGLRRVFGYDPTPIEVSAELLKAMLVGTTVESDRKDGGEATANADVGGGQKAVPPSKRFSAETADQFTRTFIATEIAENRRPTKNNLRAAAIKAGKVGARKLLDGAYNRQRPDRRVGRPSNAPLEKSAEKSAKKSAEK